MDKELNAYLEKVERGLRSLPASERIDIVSEIRSEIQELSASGVSTEEILTRLGSPRELTAAYLGKSLTEAKTFSLRHFLMVFAYWIYAGAGSLFLLPITAVGAAGFLLCGIASPFTGIIRLVSYLCGHDIPNFCFQMGSYVAGPVAYLPISFAVGAVSCLVGWLCWKITLWFIRSLRTGRKHLSKDQ